MNEKVLNIYLPVTSLVVTSLFGLATYHVADASHIPNRQGLPLDPNRPPWARPAIWLGLFLLLFSFAWDIAEHFR